MTSGLLISRITKNNLYKKYLIDRNNNNLTAYKTYRNLFNSTLRHSKKIYFEQNLEQAKHDPKRTWDLLREATNMKTTKSCIESISVVETAHQRIVSL